VRSKTARLCLERVGETVRQEVCGRDARRFRKICSWQNERRQPTTECLEDGCSVTVRPCRGRRDWRLPMASDHRRYDRDGEPSTYRER